MPLITDIHGTREVSEAEAAELRERAGATYDAWWAELVWQPIATYDRAAGVSELLRADLAWDIGYWGDGAWRNAQDSMEGEPLLFEPVEWAALDDEWRMALIED